MTEHIAASFAYNLIYANILLLNIECIQLIEKLSFRSIDWCWIKVAHVGSVLICPNALET